MRIRNHIKFLLAMLVVLFFSTTNTLFAQGIAINSTGAPPDASTVLDISSINKGFLAPRVTLTGTTDVATVPSAAVSLIVYNTATVSDVTPGYYYWTGTIWKRWLNEDPLDINWDLTGNANTVPGTHFIGTTDNVTLDFRTNNTIKYRVNNQSLEVFNSSRGVYLGEGAATGNLYPAATYGGIAIGYQASNSVTNSSSIGIGYRALYSVTGDASGNTAIGRESLKNLRATTGLNAQNNTAIGSFALYSATTASGNTAIGDSALYSLLTTSSNIAIGKGAMRNATPSTSVAIGTNALKNSTANEVISIGYYAGLNNTSGIYNVGIGSYALALNTTASNNVAVGYEAGYTANTGTNTLIGYQAGKSIAGSGNVCVGYQAGKNETGSDKLYIDNTSTSTPLIWGDFSANKVGINRVVPGASTNALEISGEASKAAAGNWISNSDKRIKTDIKDVENGIETIMKLRPVKFKYTDEWKGRNPSLTDRYYYNYIAQEFQQVFPDAVQGSGEYLENDSTEILQIDTYNTQIVAIKAIQEQQELIEQQKHILKNLKETTLTERKKILEQKEEVEKLEKHYSELINNENK